MSVISQLTYHVVKLDTYFTVKLRKQPMFRGAIDGFPAYFMVFKNLT